MVQEILSFAAVLLIIAAVTGRASAQDAADLTRTFDAYHGAAKAGDVPKLLSLLSAQVKKEFQGELAAKDGAKNMVKFAQAQTPDSYEVQHVSWAKDGQTATLFLLGQFAAMPEIERPRMRVEESVEFKKEDKEWKINLFRPLADPDKIKRPKDLTYDPKNANENTTSNIGGRIVKTEFKPEYTLVILRVMDEEYAVFLPKKAVLEGAGESAETLAPWKLHEFEGNSHNSDPLKFFGTGGKPIEE